MLILAGEAYNTQSSWLDIFLPERIQVTSDMKWQRSLKLPIQLRYLMRGPFPMSDINPNNAEGMGVRD